MTAPDTGNSWRDRESSRQRAALLLACALILVWGINFSVLKAVLSTLTPSGFLFIRYLIMPLCAAALLWQRYGRHWPRLPRADLWALLRLGLLGHLLHVGLVTFGIHWSTAFSSSLILACGPVFTLLLLRGLGVERLTRAQIVGVAIACIGVLIFLSDKLLGAQWRASGGDVILLLAAFFFSAYTVKAKPLIERHGAVLVMAYATLLAVSFGAAQLACWPCCGMARGAAGDLGWTAVGGCPLLIRWLDRLGMGQCHVGRRSHSPIDLPDASGGRIGGMVGNPGGLRRN